jgi:MFS transporter, DHA1 family, multidrug resistance protein
MPLQSKSVSFPFFLGLVAALSPVSIDITLPSLPAVAGHFGVDAAATQLTLTAFFGGMACGQLLYGPISDRFGRRPTLLAGIALCLGGTLVCANAGSIDMLITGRFFQALGASSGTVVSRSIVRDCYAWGEAGRVLSLISVVFGVVPIVGPMLGSLLLEAGGWPAVFWFIASFATVLLGLVALQLPETAPQPRDHALAPLSLARSFGFLLVQRHFLGYLLVLVSIHIAIFAFLSSSSFVLIQALGYSPRQYGVIFSVVMIGHLLGAVTGSRLVLKLGLDRGIRLGAQIAFVSGALLAVLAGWGFVSALAVVIPTFFFMFGAALVMPLATAAAMSPYPKLAGAASSLLGVSYMGTGALVSYVLGLLFDGTARPLAGAIALSGLATLLLFELIIRRLHRRADLRQR